MFTHRIDEHSEIRLAEERHVEPLYALIDRNREHLRRWLPWVDESRSSGDTRDFVRGSLKRFAAGNGFDAAIWHRGELAGMIGLHAIDRGNRRTSIGYWLGAEFEGRGLMTAACSALLDHVFGELELNRVEIRCATENRRSCAIPERLGFTLEGRAREAEWLHDRFVDHAVYAMLAAEWRGGGPADADR